MTTTKALTNSLLKSGEKGQCRDAFYVRETFSRYGVKCYAVLVDHTSVFNDLPSLPEYQSCGFFTFDVNVASHDVKLLEIDGSDLPSCDGWLVLSTSRAATFGLNQMLMTIGKENQIVVRLYEGQTTQMSAYMDMFSGETESLIYINHYFDRKYRVLYPIDLRYTICECDGTIRKSGQRIIPPGGQVVFDTRQMDLGEFEGYFWVELELENLQVRVQPFIHFWADYISDSGICRNHQSGWSPWPAETIFNRGCLPVDKNLE